jgi:hypothetical protein
LENPKIAALKKSSRKRNSTIGNPDNNLQLANNHLQHVDSFNHATNEHCTVINLGALIPR